MLIMIISEGALRKWVLPGQLGNFAYFAKDLIAILFILFNPIPAAQKLARSFSGAVLILAVALSPWVAIGMFTSPLSATLTLKHVVVWPLFAAHAMARSSRIQLDKIERLLLVAVLLNAALGILQSHSPPTAFVNRMAWQSYEGMENGINDASFGNYVRAAGTFSYLSGLTNFSQFGIFFFLWRTSLSTFWTPLVGFCASCVCGLATGSRASLVFAFAGTMLLIVLSRRSAQLIKLTPVLLAGGLLLALGPLRSFSEAFWDRWQNTQDASVTERAIPLFGEAFELLTLHPFGNGLGTASQWTSFQTASETQQLEGAEDRIVRLTSEIGVMAALVVVVLATIPLELIVIAFRLPKRKATAVLPILGLSYSILSGNAFFDHVAAALWWTALVLVAPTLIPETRTAPSNRANLIACRS